MGLNNSNVIEANIFDFQEYSSFPSVFRGSEKIDFTKISKINGHVASVKLDSVDINIF